MSPTSTTTVKDLCREAERTSRDLQLSSQPIKLWLTNGERLIILTARTVFQRLKDGDEVSKLVATREGATMLDGQLTGDNLYILEKKPDCWRLLLQRLAGNAAKTAIFKTNKPVNWFLVMSGENLNDKFFDNIEPWAEFVRQATYIIVGGEEAVLVLYQDRQFNFNNAVPTKPQFFRDFVDSDKTEREGPTKFADFLWKVRRLGGSVALADVKDIQLEDGFLVLLLGCGDLLLYSKTGKRTLARQVSSFTLHSGCLTLLTLDRRIYHAQIKDCEGIVFEECKLRAGDALEDVFETSRSIQRVCKEISLQETCLQQLKVFSELAEKSRLFDVDVKVEVSCSAPVLNLQVRLISEDVRIEAGFFQLNLAVSTSQTSHQTNVQVNQMRCNESLCCDLALPSSLDTHDFPLILAANLVLLNNKIVDSADYIFSGRVVEHEVSPFSFLVKCQEPYSASKTFTDSSDRSKFLSLLDDDDADSVGRRRSKKQAKIDLQTLENNPCQVLFHLVSQPKTSVLYQFLGKEVILECKDLQEESSEATIILTSTNKSLLSLLNNFIRKHYSP